MAGMVGMSIEEVRALSSQLKQAADQVRQLTSTLSGKLETTTWVGQDQARFVSEWNSNHKSNLMRVAEALTQAGADAERNAQQQEQTSNG